MLDYTLNAKHSVDSMAAKSQSNNKWIHIRLLVGSAPRKV